MKKITLSSIISSAIVLPVVAFAQPAVNIGSMQQLVTKIESFMWIVFGGLAVIMFVVSGILFLVAQGDPEKVQTARASFIWGIVGVVVAIVAYSIIAIISSVVA
jgi:hypothetical protein